MKRFALYIAAFLMVAGCSKNERTLSLMSDYPTKIHEFTAEIATDTKTSIRTDGKVDWAAGDVIQYYCLKNGTVRDFHIQDSCHTASIAAEIETSASFLIAAYGGNAITDNTGTGFTLTGTGIKKVQDGKFGSGHVSVVKTYDLDGKILSFQNVSGFIRFSLERTDIDHIVFKSLDKTPLAGDGKLSFTFSGTDYSVGFSSGIDSLTVSTNGAGTFYIATLPCVMEGFLIKCYDKQNHFLGEVKKNKKLSLSANKIVNLGMLDEHIVDISIQCLSLNTKRAFLQTGDAFQFRTVIEPYYAKVKSQEWHIDDEGIATLSEDGKLTAKSEGRCFVTVKVNGKLDDTCVVDIRNRNDLSRYGTANSYIVSKTGTYKFRADVKGNSTEPLGDTPFKAVVLWESFGTATKPAVGDVVTDVSFSEGYIHFTSGADGNAVIAVKSIDDEILWSWHIWVCGDYSPERYAQPYYHKAGIMMDRNIGALSKYGVESYGLLYQWGRKDPFLGTSSTDYGDKYHPAASSKEWPAPIYNKKISVEESVKNPMLFVTDYERGWETSYRTDLWSSDKTVYDPCPVGWKLPSTEIWVKSSGAEYGEISKYDNVGKVFSSLDVTYPNAGQIHLGHSSYEGDRYYYLQGVFCWSYEINPNTSGYRYYSLGLVQISTSTSWYARGTDLRSYGMSVRCVQE